MVALQMGMAYAVGFTTLGLILLSNEIDGRLKPAFEEFKSVWMDALEPFVRAFTTGALAILEVFTALGKVMKRFAELHPQLSQLFWGFLYLTMVLTLLLSPMAIGIGLGHGLAASFTLLWGAIAPFILGFLTVIGLALLLAAAFVTVTAVIHNMWNASESFRTAIVTAWQSIKTAFFEAMEPVAAKWEELKIAFMGMIHTMTGGEAHSMGEFWTWLGDTIAPIITWIASILLPVLSLAFSIASQLIVGALDLIIWTAKFLADQWNQHGATISGVVAFLWGYIVQAFTAIWGFIQQCMPQIREIINNAFTLIKAIISATFNYILPFVIYVLKEISKQFSWIFPIILEIVQSTWKTIKSAFKNAMDFVNNLIKTATAILNGDWEKALNLMVDTVESGVKLVWDLVQLWIGGKVIGLFGKVAGWIAGALVGVGDVIEKPFKDGYNKVTGWIDDIKGAMKDMFKGKISLPKFTFSGSMNPKEWAKGNLPKVGVSWNAAGNIFDGASILGGGQGVGEAGAEAVIPIERSRYLKPWAKVMSSLITDNMGGGSSRQSAGGNQYSIQFNEPVVIREDADITRIVDEMEKRKRIEERAKGTFAYQG